MVTTKIPVTMDTMFRLDISEVSFSQTGLYCAIISQDAMHVLHAIYRGEDVSVRDPEFKTSYLHLVVVEATTKTEERLTSVVYQLSNAGIDVDATQYTGETALELAINRGLSHMVGALIRVGSDLTKKDYNRLISELSEPTQTEIRDVYDRFVPGLRSAVECDNYGMVQVLVGSWCRIHVEHEGKLLLGGARSTCSADMVTLLDDYEVTLEFVHATLGGDEQRMYEFLMDSKPCDPYIMDISYCDPDTGLLTPRSLRDTAISLGHRHVLHLLPEDDLDLDPDVKGYFGGLTLEMTNRRSTSMSPKRSSWNGSNHSSETSIEVKSSKTKTSKLKPMKAKTPYALPLKVSEISKPDIISESTSHLTKEERLLKLQLDLIKLNCKYGIDIDQTYERSKLTGSVAMRTKTKSRRSLIGSYSLDDDFDIGRAHNNLTSQSLDFDDHNIDHIATPRGNKPSLRDLNLLSKAQDYGKNWNRSSLRSSGRSSKHPKEIMSRACVIS